MRGALPVLAHGAVRLEPFAPGHRDALKAACAEDEAIWQVYSISLLGEGFDAFWAASLDGSRGWQMWAILRDGLLVGCTGFCPDPQTPGVVEVGTTYLAPGARGSAVNGTAKWLVLSHLFGSGFHRVEFRVDDRNGRSKAAVEKIGARWEGLLRRHKITHTGFIRDTNVFAILDTEWPAIEARLRP
jgi:RimJ/RimL family protein N-acetyltransferase